MTTYWMMIKKPPLSNWFMYRIGDDSSSQLDLIRRIWEPKYRPDKHPIDSDYDQVPDSVMILLGLPL